MEKLKEYLTNNKKVVLPVFILLVLLLAGGIWFALQNGNPKDTKKPEAQRMEQKEQKQAKIEKEVKLEEIKPLMDKGVIKGIKDYTFTKQTKVDLKKRISFDDSIIEKVDIDDGKVDTAKKGTYTVLYTITFKGEPLQAYIAKNKDVKLTFDTDADTIIVNVKTTVTIENEKQKKKDKKQDKKDTAAKETKETAVKQQETKKTDHGTSSSNSGASNTTPKPNQGSNTASTSKPSGGSTSNGGTANTVKPSESKEPVHEHKYNIYVPEKSHTEQREVPYTVHVAQYEIVADWYECNHCHKRFEVEEDVAIHCMDVCGCGWTYKTDTRFTGMKEETEYKTQTVKVVDEPAYYKCACGARYS